MTGYRKIDMGTWPRREHYQYYTQKLKIECNMTVPIDVKNLLDFCHASGHKFYPSLIYLVTKIVNGMENLRMFKNADGDLCVWNQVVPNYTIFHEDDKTFSDCWTAYSEDFETFYREITKDMEEGKKKKGIKVKAGQPANFYCISCVPWVAFTGYGSRTVNSAEPVYFPIITMGKYEKSGEQVLMPVNMMVAHAVADGYHAGRFFQKLQEAVNRLDFADLECEASAKSVAVCAKCNSNEVLTESEDDVKNHLDRKQKTL